MKQIVNLRRLFYNLARQFGEEITVTIPQSRDTNYATGVISKENDTHTFKNVPVLPADMARDFVYDLSFIAANKNFTYGGIFNKGERLVLIDVDHLEIVIDDISIITIDSVDFLVSQWTSYSDQHFALIVKTTESRH